MKHLTFILAITVIHFAAYGQGTPQSMAWVTYYGNGTIGDGGYYYVDGTAVNYNNFIAGTASVTQALPLIKYWDAENTTYYYYGSMDVFYQGLYSATYCRRIYIQITLADGVIHPSIKVGTGTYTELMLGRGNNSWLDIRRKANGDLASDILGIHTSNATPGEIQLNGLDLIAGDTSSTQPTTQPVHEFEAPARSQPIAPGPATRSSWLAQIEEHLNGNSYEDNVVEHAQREGAALTTDALGDTTDVLTEAAENVAQVKDALRQFITYFKPTGLAVMDGDIQGSSQKVPWRAWGYTYIYEPLYHAIDLYNDYVGIKFDELFAMVRYFGDALTLIATALLIMQNVAWAIGFAPGMPVDVRVTNMVHVSDE